MIRRNAISGQLFAKRAAVLAGIYLALCVTLFILFWLGNTSFANKSNVKRDVHYVATLIQESSRGVHGNKIDTRSSECVNEYLSFNKVTRCFVTATVNVGQVPFGMPFADIEKYLGQHGWHKQPYSRYSPHISYSKDDLILSISRLSDEGLINIQGHYWVCTQSFVFCLPPAQD